ncbi:hypothetical protein DYB37_011483 [Aphanomyces astaci]|uniref:Nitroreductase domain-containing protein n=1 Tax=Aphanomyces astaci TaxID=112090 RepID=A0A397FD62_APHAT|nr:hypothetical protein AaE_005415 [Aphanomyces astaci]RHY48263.1 hypothetical protein DYB34_013743 [Aphanomyces astaci]RHY53377.1 hypothetical protein DYB30_009936 [Aphanomyces astaci]RHZ17772.1 hypothetical protein DYB37_011483 [Aphanomyces astaci]RHZ27742.1 hypothetical protein DYB31_012283 [Aphanomyces astaci]
MTTRNPSYELGVQHGALAGIGLTIGASILTVAATGAGAAVWKYVKKQRQLWDVEALIAHRRSIFPQDYDATRSVPEDVLNKLLESANWAPTHGRTEPWRFVVFGGDGRRVLGEKDAEIYKKITPEASFMPKKYAKKLSSKLQASYVIAICLKRQDSKKIPEIEEVEAVACAVQNLHLRATALGVGAYWSTGPGVYSDEMKEFLHLGADDKCLGFFYVGYPKPDFKHPIGSRKPAQDKVRFVYE